MQSLTREPRARDQFRSSVSPVGYLRRKNLREDGRGLTKEGSTKIPTWNWDFHEGKPQIAMERTLEPRVLRGRERETEYGAVLER
jgi:hypothetical protein